jgi:hypothetical protein
MMGTFDNEKINFIENLAKEKGDEALEKLEAELVAQGFGSNGRR